MARPTSAPAATRALAMRRPARSTISSSVSGARPRVRNADGALRSWHDHHLSLGMALGDISQGRARVGEGVARADRRPDPAGFGQCGQLGEIILVQLCRDDGEVAASRNARPACRRATAPPSAASSRGFVLPPAMPPRIKDSFGREDAALGREGPRPGEVEDEVVARVRAREILRPIVDHRSAPSARTNSAWRALQTASTPAPNACAICTAKLPMPPPAPTTSTFRPARQSPLRRPCNAVTPATGRAAASSKESEGGLATRRASVAQASSAKAPRQAPTLRRRAGSRPPSPRRPRPRPRHRLRAARSSGGAAP